MYDDRYDEAAGVPYTEDEDDLELVDEDDWLEPDDWDDDTSWSEWRDSY